MPSLHQGDVLEEEVEEEEWSDAGRHPPRHFPAANVIRPNHTPARISHTCLHVIVFHSINYSNLSHRLNTSEEYGILESFFTLDITPLLCFVPGLTS